MTKKQILVNIRPEFNSFSFFTELEVLEAMEEYANQELTAEREKSAKLVEALEKISELNLSYNGTPLIGGIDTLIKQSLTEYKKQ